MFSLTSATRSFIGNQTKLEAGGAIVEKADVPDAIAGEKDSLKHLKNIFKSSPGQIRVVSKAPQAPLDGEDPWPL